MDYYNVKQDLAEFDTNDLKILINYYNLPKININDLLWLLAIYILDSTHYIAQMTSAKIWEKYSGELLKKFAEDSSASKYINSTELPAKIIKADPSKSKKYLKWIIESYLADGIHRLNDLPRTMKALEKYMYLLKKKLIKNKYLLNIDAFCGLYGCVQQSREKQGLKKFLKQDEFKEALYVMEYAKEYRRQEKNKIIFS